MNKDRDFKVDKELAEVLDKYTINFSTDLNKEKTLNILKDYLPIKRKSNRILTIRSLLGMSLNELMSASKYQYALMVLILVLSLPIINLSISPYQVVFFTAPIPFFIGFWNICYRGNNVMIEIEKTFKFSYYQMLCSRVVTLTYTSIMFLSLPLGYFIVNGVNIHPLSVFKLVVLGLIPIFVFSTYLLFVASVNRDNDFFIISLLIWGLFGFAAASTSIGDFMFNLHIWIYIFIIAVSILVFVINIMRIIKIQKREIVNI